MSIFTLLPGPLGLTLAPTVALAIGRAARNTGQELSFGAGYIAGDAVADVKQGFNTAKWVAIGAVALGAVVGLSIIKNALD